MRSSIPRDALEGGGGGAPLLQGAQPMPSHCPPDTKCQPQFVTDSNRPQQLRQPPPTAYPTASGAASEAPALPTHPCPPPAASGPAPTPSPRPSAEQAVAFSITVWALAMRRVRDVALMTSLGDWALQEGLAGALNAQNMANVLWAYSTLEVEHRPLVTAVAAAYPRLPDPGTAQTVSNMFLAYSRFGLCDAALFEGWARQLRSGAVPGELVCARDGGGSGCPLQATGEGAPMGHSHPQRWPAGGGGGADPRDELEGGGYPPPPRGRPAYAQPLSA